jgi:ABC-type nickel/cobalt efflux system permease component RcnA
LQVTLELTGGLLITGLGVWLLLRRLSGGADHFHLGSHSHHQAPAHSDHNSSNDEGGSPSRRVRWVSLVVLGINGGIVPCWDAIAMLVLAVALNLLWLALPLLLAFSAGLAAVLIVIGILVVRARKLLGGPWEASRLFRILPLISAALIAAMGLWMCYDSLHPETPPTPRDGISSHSPH